MDTYYSILSLVVISGCVCIQAINASNVTITPSPATTSTPAPTTTVSYTVTDANTSAVCIVLNGTIKFQLPYRTPSGNAFVDFHLPSIGSTEESTCNGNWSGKSGQLLKVTKFYQDWSFELFFENTSNQFAATKLRLNYSVSKSAQFPNASDASAYRVIALYDGSFGNPLFVPANVAGYYKCKSALTVTLNTTNLDGAASTTVGSSATFSELSAVAFSTRNTSTPVGIKTECVADYIQVDFIVPIVVGCVLLAIILIVLIAFFIGYYRSRKTYERV